MKCFFNRVVRSKKIIFMLGILVLFVGGCGERKLTTLSNEEVILAFGDSLTLGYGAEITDSYPSVLAELCRCNVVNAGISGETTNQGLERFVQVINEYHPSLLILMEGGNDILRNNTTSTKANLARMIEISLASNIQVVLVGVPEKKLFSKSAAFYTELATEYEVVFEGELLSSLLRKSQYKSDAVHFNQQGYRQFAEGVFELLKTKGAL